MIEATSRTPEGEAAHDLNTARSGRAHMEAQELFVPPFVRCTPSLGADPVVSATRPAMVASAGDCSRG
ncbi:MAG: hypothetical protein ACRD0C_20975 [Acidimicrobiia bacterium]